MLLIFGRTSSGFTHLNNTATYYIPSVIIELIGNIDEKTEVRWESLSYYHIVHEKSHTKWSRIEPEPSRWQAGLSHGSEWVSEWNGGNSCRNWPVIFDNYSVKTEYSLLYRNLRHSATLRVARHWTLFWTNDIQGTHWYHIKIEYYLKSPMNSLPFRFCDHCYVYFKQFLSHVKKLIIR